MVKTNHISIFNRIRKSFYFLFEKENNLRNSVKYKENDCILSLRLEKDQKSQFCLEKKNLVKNRAFRLENLKSVIFQSAI